MGLIRRFGEILVGLGELLSSRSPAPSADSLTVTRRSGNVGFTERAEQLIEDGRRRDERPAPAADAPLAGSLASRRAAGDLAGR
jgi:hypothetical protein